MNVQMSHKKCEPDYRLDTDDKECGEIRFPDLHGVALVCVHDDGTIQAWHPVSMIVMQRCIWGETSDCAYQFDDWHHNAQGGNTYGFGPLAKEGVVREFGGIIQHVDEPSVDAIFHVKSRFWSYN